MKILSEILGKVRETKACDIPSDWALHWQSLNQSHNKYENFHPAIQRILTRPRIPTHSDAWHQERKVRISATNTGAILTNSKLRGKSKWTTYNDLLLIKTSRKKEQFSSFCRTAMDHGIAHEEEAALAYSRATGIELVPEDIGMLVHQEHEHISASPDRVARYYPINIEIKCPFVRRKLKREIPDHYYAQVQQQMAVMELTETHFVQYIPPTEIEEGQLTICRVFFDQPYWNEVLNHIHLFYAEMVKFYSQLSLPLGTEVAELFQEDEKEKQTKRRKSKKWQPPILTEKCI